MMMIGVSDQIKNTLLEGKREVYKGRKQYK